MAGDEDHWLRAVLSGDFAADVAVLAPLQRSEKRLVYRVDLADGRAWVLRAESAAGNEGDAAYTPADAPSHAAVLDFLERHRYPAPRLVPAADGSPAILREGWWLNVTTLVPGGPPDWSPQYLETLGEALGRLHALPVSRGGTGDAGANTAALASASMLPRSELTVGRRWLMRVADLVPSHQLARHRELVEACGAIDYCEDLPEVLVHNDCHPGNSVKGPDGRAVLIDWEGAGLGPAVIDLGNLLVCCEIEAFRPNRLAPTPDRVNAVVDGYRRHRSPARTELDRLANAIRFRSVMAAADEFSRAVRDGKPEDPSPWYWRRYQASDEIAERATQRFAHD